MIVDEIRTSSNGLHCLHDAYRFFGFEEDKAPKPFMLCAEYKELMIDLIINSDIKTGDRTTRDQAAVSAVIGKTREVVDGEVWGDSATLMRYLCWADSTVAAFAFDVLGSRSMSLDKIMAAHKDGESEIIKSKEGLSEALNLAFPFFEFQHPAESK